MAVVTIQGILEEPIKKLLTPEAVSFMYQTFYNKMFPYIPFVTGNLASDYTIEEDGIHFNAIYSTRQYFGTEFNFTKDQHPLAQALWADVAWNTHEKEINEELLHFLER